MLVLHPHEQLRPVSVDGFLADATLSGNHYDLPACSSSEGPAALDCYAAADAAHAAPPVAYGAYLRAGTRVVLEYWLFYSFNLYSPTDPAGELWQDHEGDWEAVVVVLDARAKPLYAGTSRHCGGARRAWARVPRRGTHPVVYVALGSHANYFAPGEIPLDRRCWPAAALAVFDTYHLPARDHVAAGPTVSPRLSVVTASSPAWMRFTGTWGEAQYVHVPGREPLAYGLAPAGPSSHALWRKPIATLVGWPAG